MDTRNVAKAKTHFFTDVDISDVLVPIEAAAGRCQWGTKIAVTLGPACQSTDTLVELLESGMTCARIDVTWGTLEYHKRSLSNLAAAMRRAQRLCSVWLDTTGREVAVRQAVTLDESGWPKLGAPLDIKRGSSVTLTASPTAQVSPSLLPITAPSLALHVFPGTVVEVGRYLGTGATGATLRLRVLSVTRDQEVVCQALHDASLDGLLTVMAHHAPDSHDAAWDLDLPILTEADVAALRSLGAEYEIDYVSASFVSCAADVADVRGVLDALGLHQTKIVAKVERRPGIRHFEAIAAAADAILLSRGNLGLDYDAELMAILQKHVVGRCNALGKPIFLTRFVDTMVSAPRPTRAEATDVANAVLDGVDGILLGAETQSGAHARLTVETIARLARCAERHFDYRSHHDRLADDDEEGLGIASARGGGGGAQGASAGPRPGSPQGGAQSPLYRSMADLRVPSRVFLFSEDRPVLVAAEDAADEDVSRAAGARAGSFTGQPPLPDARSPTAGAGASRPPRPGGEGSGSPRRGAAPSSVGIGGHSQAGPPRRVPSAANLARADSMAGLTAEEVMTHASGKHYVSAFGTLSGSSAAAVSGAAASCLRRVLRGGGLSWVNKLESVASTATRTAEKIGAGLIVVMSQTGRTVSLVSKFRPPMPILAVVVPTLRSNGLSWKLEGRNLARQCLVMRGVWPMLAAPMSEANEELLDEAVAVAHAEKLVKGADYVVCILSQRGALVVKVVQVDETGAGIKLLADPNALLGDAACEEGGEFASSSMRLFARQGSIAFATAGLPGTPRKRDDSDAAVGLGDARMRRLSSLRRPSLVLREPARRE